MRKFAYFLMVLALLPLGYGSDCSGGGDPLQTPKKLLYVLDNGNDAVYVLEGVDTIDGVVAPSRTISGDKTLITNPTAVAVDTRRDILYVADASERMVLVYAPASTTDGDVDPTRTIPAGGNIQRMFLDETNNRLYVFNATELTIQEWDDVSTVNGTVPDRFFNLDFLASAIFVDTERDFLYAGDFISMVIPVYNQVSTLIGSPLPSRIISDDERPFDRIDGITMNTDNDILYYANSLKPSIDIYLNALTVNGEVDPDRILEGDNTALTSELGFIKFLDNVLYVRNTPTDITVFDDANNLDGDVAPSRTITVDGADRIISFDIDLQH